MNRRWLSIISMKEKGTPDASGNGHHGKIVGAKWVPVIPNSDYAADRRVATWVLDQGGRVRIEAGAAAPGETSDYLVAADELPQEPFRLVEVQLDHNRNLRHEQLEQLTTLMHLRIVRLEYSRLPDDSLRVLANCPSLEMLYAPNNQLTDAGMLHLRDMPKLWLLHLSSNHITDAGLAHLASLTNLRQLYLARTDINDVAIPHLSRLSNLKQLDLAGTAVTPAAVATLQPALPECEILTRSYESRGFALQFDGQTTFATLPVIYDGSTPLTVEMWMTYEPGKAHDWTPFLIGNRWGEDGLVLRADRNRPAVELRGSGQAVSAEPFPSGRMFHVAGVFTADELRLYVDGILAARQPVTEDRRATSKPFVLGAVTWEALESENAEELTGLLQGSVDAVRLSSTERYTTDFFPDTRFIPDEHTLALYHFDEGQGDVLTDASGNGHHGKIVGATWVPGPSVPYDVDRRIATELLSNGPGPHVAVLIGDQRRTIGSVEELPAEPFRVVAVEFDGKSPDDLQPLGELRFVEWINLQGCAVTDEDLKPLQGCVSLQDLGVKLTQVTGPGFGYLVGLPNLRSLDLGGSSATDVALLHIGELTGIESLEMIYSEVTDAGLSQLGNLKRLSRLSIFGSHVTGAGLSHLSKDRLTVLGVAQSAVSDADVETLKKFQALVHLNLTGTRMTADGAQRLARALPNCKIVTDFGVFDPGVSTPADFALQFDGVDDYVEIPLPGVTLGPEFTVELQADTLTVPTIAEGPAEVTWLLDWPRDEALSLEWWAWSAEKTDFSASVNKAGALSFSKWQEPAPGPHHFAVVYRDGATQLYVDGRALDYNGQSQVDPAGLASQVLAIGARLPVEEMQNAQFHFFQGLVDELRISTVARYTEDFEPAVRHEVDAHTLALYHFDEGEGEILHDASGNGHHGKIVGATWVPALATADGRDIAEWVLAIGGKVTVQLVGEEQPRLIATAEALPQEAWRLVGVDLSYTKVTDDDLARLRGAAALQTLNLDSAELIGDAGLLNLAGLPLTSLDLRNTQVTDGSVPVLQQLPQLSLLSLAHTGVTDAGMAGLAKLSRLEQLNVCNNPITDAGLAELRGLSSLKSLASYDTAITDAGLAHVAEMTALEYLHVGDTQVSDAGLIHLSSLKQLRQLNLDRTAVSDAGLVHLAALPSIAALWLEETQITDAGLQHLKPLSTLGDLSVKRTAVTEAGLQQLHADLPACRIDSDFGTVEPANDRAVAEWVLSRQGLVGLREGDADVQVREVSELPAACRVLKVSLGDVSDSDLINLKGLEGLRELTLRNCPQLTDAGLVHLRELPNLRWLILGGTAPDLKSQVSDRGMALFLEGFPRLEFVSLQYEAITDEGLRHLCSKPGLGMLDLYGTSISDEGLQHLPQLAGLSIVTLPEQIGDAGLAHLKGMKSLTTVYLPGCDRITIEGLRTLASLPSLFELQLTNTQLNDEDVLVLAGSTTLKKLHLRGTEVTQDGIDRLRQALPACWIDSDFGTFEPAADAESTGATP